MRCNHVHRFEAVHALACVGWIAIGLVAGGAPSHAQTYTITDLSTGQENDFDNPVRPQQSWGSGRRIADRVAGKRGVVQQRNNHSY